MRTETGQSCAVSESCVEIRITDAFCWCLMILLGKWMHFLTSWKDLVDFLLSSKHFWILLNFGLKSGFRDSVLYRALVHEVVISVNIGYALSPPTRVKYMGWKGNVSKVWALSVCHNVDISLSPDEWAAHWLYIVYQEGSLRLRPYQPEYARSRPISEAKQGRAWLVLGWETAWEYQVL